MSNKSVKLNLPKEFREYMWFRYLPDSTFKAYMLVGMAMSQRLEGEEALKLVMGMKLESQAELPEAVVEEKKKVLKKFGLEYPSSREEDIKLLQKLKLIIVGKTKKGNIAFVCTNPIPKPEDVLDIDDEERAILEQVKFEAKYQNAFNMVLTLMLNNSGSYVGSLKHICDTTKVKLSEVKKVLDYLINEEKSLSLRSNKKFESLKKDDKIYIDIVKEVFEEKRFVISE
ncbi:DUF6042 family protein [Peptostreptococcaceae bacterium AGR-M142]